MGQADQGTRTSRHFRVAAHPTEPLSLCRFSGPLRRTAALTEIERAYASGDFRPGADRVIVVDPGVALNEAPVSDLFEVQQCVAMAEVQAPRRRNYRAVFVAPPEQAGLAIDFYFLFWAQETRVRPTFYRCRELRVAEAVLGVSGLATAFAALLSV